jgi:hypothetical protein
MTTHHIQPTLRISIELPGALLDAVCSWPWMADAAAIDVHRYGPI